MKLFNSLALLLMLTGVTSCEKNENTVIVVTVKDQYTHLPLPGKKITLSEVSDNYIIMDDYSEVKIGYTDANGRFDFGLLETKKKKKYHYLVDIGQVPEGRPYSSLNFINTGSNNYIEYTEDVRTGLKVILLTEPPYPAGDSIRISIYNSNLGSSTTKGFNNSDYRIGGAYLRCYLGDNYLRIDKYKDGIYTITKDTIKMTNANSVLGEYYVNW